MKKEGLLVGYSKRYTVSALAQVIICLDSSTVDLIKTLSTYLPCSAGEYCYPRQQNPCSTCRIMLNSLFIQLSPHPVLYIYCMSHNHSAVLRGTCSWMMLLFSCMTEARPPEILLLSSFLIPSEGGLAPWLSYKHHNRWLSAYLWKHGCIRIQSTLWTKGN